MPQYVEKWERYGDNIKNYVEINREFLKSINPHVIAGFTTGGAILAHVFGSYLKDILGEELCSCHEIATTSIPIGLSKKTYSESCFGIRFMGDSQDIDGFRSFYEELKQYMERNNIEKLRLILFDDNITGSGRIKYYYDKLIKLFDGNIEIYPFCYVRHLSFSDKDPFVFPIITTNLFEVEGNYFTMPHHNKQKPHRNILYDNKIDKHFSVLIRIKGSSDETKIKNYIVACLKKNKYKFKELSEGRWGYIVYNDNMYFVIQRIDVGISIQYRYLVFYPPKKCLNGKKSFDYALCEQTRGNQKILSQCMACSFMNCNSSILRELVNAPFSEAYSVIKQGRDLNKKDIDSIYRFLSH